MAIPLQTKNQVADEIRHADSLRRLCKARTVRGLAEYFGVAPRTIIRAYDSRPQSLTDEECETIREAKKELEYLRAEIRAKHTDDAIAERHGINGMTVHHIKSEMIQRGLYNQSQKRSTLTSYIFSELRMMPAELSKALSVPSYMLENWWLNNRELLSCIVHGYKGQNSK